MVTVLLVGSPVVSPVLTDPITSLGGACSGVRVKVARTVTSPSAATIVPVPTVTATLGSTTDFAEAAPAVMAPPP